MTLAAAWVAFPLVCCAVALGCGLLVEWIADTRLPRPLLLPLGLALVVIVSQLATYGEATAALATPALVALALAGLVLGRARLRGPVDRWAVAMAVGVFGVYALPVLASTEATFLGYGILTDTAIHFELVDHLMEEGRDHSGLARSSYQETVRGYLIHAYPTGSHTALGALLPLAGLEVPWAYQPFLALISAMTALSLYALLTSAVAARPLRALAAFIAAQPGLVYAFSLQGSIKELATIWALALTAALVVPFLRDRTGWRRVVPLAVASAAGIGVISLSIAPWLGPILLVSLVALARRRPRRDWRRIGSATAAFAIATVVMSFPSLAAAGTFVTEHRGFLTAQEELGNLIGHLDPLQVFGIWPRGDYRFPLEVNDEVGYVLIGVAALAAVLGLVLVAWNRLWSPLLFIAVSVFGCLFVLRQGSPWADAKALAIVSPAVVLASMLGTVALRTMGRRVEAAIVAAAIVFGVVWTNVLAYGEADVAPRGRLLELDRIGQRIAGQGPTLYTEHEEFAKYFLRAGAPTGSSERVPGIPTILSNGQESPSGFSHDLDQLALPYVRRFRTIVLRRSPVHSRPPANYRRTFSGRYYDVWQRPRRGGLEVVAHTPLGDAVQPGGRLACPDARSAALQARRIRGRLAYAPRPRVPVLTPAEARRTGAIELDTDPLLLRQRGEGRISGSIRVPRDGRYTIWLAGSFGLPYTVRIDGRRAGTVENELGDRREFLSLGEVSLRRGRRRVEAVAAGPDLRPGRASKTRHVGMLVLNPSSRRELPARVVPVGRWRALCRAPVDWIEVVRGRDAGGDRRRS